LIESSFNPEPKAQVTSRGAVAWGSGLNDCRKLPYYVKLAAWQNATVQPHRSLGRNMLTRGEASSIHPAAKERRFTESLPYRISELDFQAEND